MQIKDNSQALFDHLQKQATLTAQYDKLQYQPWRWLWMVLLVAASIAFGAQLALWLSGNTTAAVKSTASGYSLLLISVLVGLFYLHREIAQVHQRLNLLKQLIDHNNMTGDIAKAAQPQTTGD